MSINSSFWDTSVPLFTVPCRCCIQLDDFKVWTCEYLWIPDSLGCDSSTALPPHVRHQRDQRGDCCRRNALTRRGHLSCERGSRAGHTCCHRFVHQHWRRFHNHTAVRMPFKHPTTPFKHVLCHSSILLCHSTILLCHSNILVAVKGKRTPVKSY